MTDSNPPQTPGPRYSRCVVANRTMDDIAVEAGWRDGMSVRSLDAGTVVVIHTRRSRYRVVTLDTPQKVRLEGGSLCAPVEASVVGATAGGSMVKLGWIGIGLRLELQIGGERVTTSTVESVAIESLPPEHSATTAAA
jgi:hypothetical protein